jgi:DMSO reductase anchor subunit
VLFSALTITGAGLLAGHFAAWALGLTAFTPKRCTAGVATILLAAGLLLSLLHLGRPARLVYVLRRVGRSPLSTEVILALLTTLSAAAAQLLPFRQTASALLWGLAAAASPGLLLALGWVYRLPGQLSWRGAVALSPLLLGLATGFLAHASSAEENARFMSAAFALLAADATAFAMRWKVMKRDPAPGQPVHPALFSVRRRILILRLMDVTLLPAFFMLAQAPMVALFVLAFGIFFDRFAFYALAIRETTEAEIARVEHFLSSR